MRHNTDLVLHLRWIYKLVRISLGIRLKHSVDLGLLLHCLLRTPWRRKRRGSSKYFLHHPHPPLATTNHHCSPLKTHTERNPSTEAEFPTWLAVSVENENPNLIFRFLSSIMASVGTHLRLGMCSCTFTCGPSFGSSSSTKKRKLSNKANIGSRNKKFKNDDDDEVWKIKKVLEKSNIGTMRRLILRREMEEEFVLPVLGDDADQIDSGVSVQIWDVDTKSILSGFQEMGFFKKLCIHWCDILEISIRNFKYVHWGKDTRIRMIDEDLKIIVLRVTKNLTKPTSEPRSRFHSERFDIYIAYFRKRAPTGAEKREELEQEKRHANRGKILAFKKSNFSLLVAEYEVTSRGRGGPLFAPLKMGQVATPNFAHHFYSKLQKEAIFGVVKCTSTLWDFEFQIMMAAQLIHDRVVMECQEGRCRFRGTIRLTATSLVHPEEPARTLQQPVEWILPTPTPYRLVELVQVIEVSSSEEDPEEDPEELPPEPAVDALDFPEDDEDPLPDVDSPEDIMSTSEADSTEESGPGGTTNIQTVRFTLLIFGWVDLLYRNFDDCIYVAEATTVDTFALDVTMGLRKGDEIGFQWNPFKNGFDFSVLQINYMG
ncbi:hypothetical protein HKD37_U058324 [Glycine soja]